MRTWSEIAATDRQRQSTNQKLQVIETRNISPLKTETATDGKRVAGTDRKNNGCSGVKHHIKAIYNPQKEAGRRARSKGGRRGKYLNNMASSPKRENSTESRKEQKKTRRESECIARRPEQTKRDRRLKNS
jgi:hypothetical protein